ncbi:MAG TPA: hypothetical protein ENH41_04710 [Candidatus Omnitrophica bacterium]|nr:hypothetical protein [Candidatus Omnitrophota bacterium]
MIVEIEGKLIRRSSDYLVIDIGGICYQILVAPMLLERLANIVDDAGKIKLTTYHYMQQDHSKTVPVLIGFLSEIEKDFFEKFITVSGIGPKAALRAINKPFSTIARAIDEANMSFLCKLPGIGQQRAKQIVAKLQGKVGKYGLIRDADTSLAKEKSDETFKDEALEILLQLQYRQSEAKAMINKAMVRSNSINTAEDLLNEVYKQRK